MSAGDELVEIRIKKVLGPTNTGTAVLLGNDEKTFLMLIGIYEGAALRRELEDEVPPRPLTHELIANILAGFSLKVKRIVISSLVSSTFRATLVLEQQCVDESGDWNGRRNEAHIDARPSDCLVLALKEKTPIYATAEVLESVRDVTEDATYSGLIEGLQELHKGSEGKKKGPFGLKEFDISGLEDLPGPFDDDDDD